MIAAWMLVGAAFSAWIVAFVKLGTQTYLDLPAVTFALTGLIAVVTLSRDHLARVLRWRVSCGLAAGLAWALVSSLASGRVFSALFGNPGNGWGWLTLVAACAIVLAAAGRRRSLRAALVAAAPWVVLVEAGIATYLWTREIWPAGSLSNPTYLVMVLSVLLPLTIVMDESTPKWDRITRWAALAAGLWTVGISGSRVGFVAVLVWVAGALWTGALAGGLSQKIRRIGLAALAVLAIPAGAWTYVSGGAGIGDFLADRLSRLSACWGGLLSRPVTGWGPDGFINGGAAHASSRLLSLSGSEFGQFGSDPHNFVGWVMVSLGIVGLALLLWIAFEVVRNWRRQAAAGVLDATFVWGFGLYAFQVLFAPAALQTLPLAALALGASLAVERSAGTAPKGSAAGKTSAAVKSGAKKVAAGKGAAGRGAAGAPNASMVFAGRAVQVALGLCAVVLLAYAFTRVTLRAPQEEPSAQRVQDAAQMWSDPYLWYHANLAWGWEMQRSPAVQSQRLDLAAVRRAVELEPGNPVYLTDLARAKAVYGMPEAEVRAAFEDVYDIFPLSPDAHASYAEYLLAKKDAKAAWEQLEPVSAMDSTEVWRVLAEYYVAVDEPGKAAQYQQKMDARLKAQTW